MCVSLWLLDYFTLEEGMKLLRWAKGAKATALRPFSFHFVMLFYVCDFGRFTVLCMIPLFLAICCLWHSSKEHFVMTTAVILPRIVPLYTLYALYWIGRLLKGTFDSRRACAVMILLFFCRMWKVFCNDQIGKPHTENTRRAALNRIRLLTRQRNYDATLWRATSIGEETLIKSSWCHPFR